MNGYLFFETYAEEDGFFFLSPHCLATINAMTVFFEVFYTNQCYDRYFLLSRQVNEVFQSCHRFSFSLKALLGTKREYFGLVMRFVRVSLILFLAFVKFGDDINDELFEELVDLQLLTPEEHADLARYTGPQIQLVLLDWMMRGTQAGHGKLSKEQPAKAPAMLRDAFAKLVGLDVAQKDVLQTIRMPVPYQYFQLLNLTVSINICTWAYSMSRTDSVFGPLAYICVSFVFIGMMTLANLFASPFGEDEVDFPLHEWMNTFLSNQVAYMESGYPGGASSLEAMATSGALGYHNDILLTERQTQTSRRLSSNTDLASARLMLLVRDGKKAIKHTAKASDRSYSYLPMASDGEDENATDVREARQIIS